MAIHIEAQNTNEVMAIRSRELQLENTEKLEQIIPVVESIEDVDLNTIEDNTNQIKTMIEDNIDSQINLDDMAEMVTTTQKGITELKKSITRLSNTMKDVAKKMDELDAKLGDDING